MHNIKLIRDAPDKFEKKIKERNTNLDLKKILDLDKKNRDLIQNKEKLEQEKKIFQRKRTRVNFQDQKKYLKKLTKLMKLIQKLKNN